MTQLLRPYLTEEKENDAKERIDAFTKCIPHDFPSPNTKIKLSPMGVGDLILRGRIVGKENS